MVSFTMVDLINLGLDAINNVCALQRDCLKYFQYRDSCKKRIQLLFDDLVRNTSQVALAQYSIHVSLKLYEDTKQEEKFKTLDNILKQKNISRLLCFGMFGKLEEAIDELNDIEIQNDNEDEITERLCENIEKYNDRYAQLLVLFAELKDKDLIIDTF